ncbi:hydantoinase B/oxoprolinase family protein, partial [Bacillus licheniformis]|nr:hydantoinase B/oxoprolinase family protein [Bacillus licheniformis]
GGGGWGNPFRREAESILGEVEAGLLSPEAAYHQYGVAVKENGAGSFIIDLEETAEIRKKKAGEHRKQWDFGIAREEYERCWTEEASSTLARLLRQLPAHQRSHVKHLVHRYFSKEHNGPISKSEVAAAVEKLAGKNNTGMVR